MPSDNKLWKQFSMYIRLRDADENGFISCFTCGAIRHWKHCDCGHGIGRQHRGTKYNEMNNHAQCKPCNAFEGGATKEYAEAVDRKYGAGTWDKLLILSKARTRQLSKFEIDVLTKEYAAKVKELLKHKSG